MQHLVSPYRSQHHFLHTHTHPPHRHRALPPGLSFSILLTLRHRLASPSTERGREQEPPRGAPRRAHGNPPPPPGAPLPAALPVPSSPAPQARPFPHAALPSLAWQRPLRRPLTAGPQAAPGRPRPGGRDPATDRHTDRPTDRPAAAAPGCSAAPARSCSSPPPAYPARGPGAAGRGGEGRAAPAAPLGAARSPPVAGRGGEGRAGPPERPRQARPGLTGRPDQTPRVPPPPRFSFYFPVNSKRVQNYERPEKAWCGARPADSAPYPRKATNPKQTNKPEEL